MARDTGSLNRARNRRILVQGSMRSDTVVIFGTRFEYPAQMRLAQDNDVVHPLTPDRSDQPFGKAILPGRSWCGRLVPNAHGAQSAGDNAAIDPVAIADQVVRSLIPRKGLRDLTRNPFCRRICRGVDPDEFSAVQPDDDEGIEQVETDSRDNERYVARPKADFPRSSAGSRRAASFRSAVALPMGTTSNASSSENRPYANGPASRAG